MPAIKRWFPVSHDINRDPEMWELEAKHGPKALRIWLEVLSIADRNEGIVPGELDAVSRVISSAVRSRLIPTKLVLSAMLSLGWLVLSDGLRVAKYEKYHRTRETNKFPPDLPDLPNLPKEKKKIAPSDRNLTPPTPWPKDDLWLSELLKAQTFCAHCGDQLQDYQWWEFAAMSLGGIDRPFIEKEFAKISAWWRENPTKRKTANGMKRFLRTWLEKAKNDQGRGLYAVKRR